MHLKFLNVIYPKDINVNLFGFGVSNKNNKNSFFLTKLKVT